MSRDVIDGGRTHVLPAGFDLEMVRRFAAVAAQNDAFRRDTGRPDPVSGLKGEWHATAAVLARGRGFVRRACVAVAAQDYERSPDDWYDDHALGQAEVDAERVWWKIDCFDRGQEFASADPTDPAVTVRVLTVMLSGDY